jgi:mannan endo-1,4-beta-mannosidase
MAAYAKSLDTNHLVAVGIEGFYGTGMAERLSFNPGDWAASLCSDFIENSAVEHIDFASVHAYPDSWYIYIFSDLCKNECTIICMALMHLFCC